MKTYAELKQIQDEYAQEFLGKEPYSKYINMVAVGKPFGDDDSIDGLCLRVGLETQPPADVTLPTEYKGAKVTYEVIGKIEAQG